MGRSGKLSKEAKRAYAKAQEEARLVEPPGDPARIEKLAPWLADPSKLPKKPPGVRR